MVWAGITLDGHPQLYVFARDTVTAVRYRDEVLVLYVCLFMGAVALDFILMDGNPRHIELIWSTNFWKVRIFTGWNWPIRSPDLISIEQAWNSLGRAMLTCNSPPKTIQGLKTELLNEWD
ncbi:transposable element Tc1 transposase [Trichonephila clavipes]|uniref:Transposable element Tc1 transposase n=1 Tax=Trichonephila clavipes TaxID=2585209 RepID=A0A8X7BM14_TRICX|nr:transposable element Tc1 transposase [Trichonephila clavipes]